MQTCAPTLLELQRTLGDGLLRLDGGDAPACIVPDGLDPRARLAIYRNTACGVLVAALQLSYPAVRLLVGDECFEGAARRFIAQAPPQGAWLDAYGAGFADFLSRLPEMAALAYLPDTARLEWAVGAVLHAPDVPPLDLMQVTQWGDGAGDLRFLSHPAVRLLRANQPVDDIWRAVLTHDDDAMAAIEPDGGPVWLCVRRGGAGIDIARLGEPQWRFMAALFAGQPLHAALAATPQPEAPAWLAEMLAHGYFAAVRPADLNNANSADRAPLSEELA